MQYIQPTGRISGLQNTFRDAAKVKASPAPSFWWPWTKIDYGFRAGLGHGIDITAEQAKHNIGAPRKINEKETLITLRVKVG